MESDMHQLINRCALKVKACAIGLLFVNKASHRVIEREGIYTSNLNEFEYGDIHRF